MATMAAALRRNREAEQAQVQRARRRVDEERVAAAAVLPTAELVDATVRTALTPHLGDVLEVRTRYQRGAKGETVTARLSAACGHGVLLRTERGGTPVWVSYRDLYAGHATVLAPANARDATGRAVGRLRRGAPAPKGGS